MNAIDGTEHFEKTSEGEDNQPLLELMLIQSIAPPPSLLVVVIDTNPHAWSLLSSTISLSTALANLLIFINAHLAFNHSNRVAVIASHCQRTVWLYPSPATGPPHPTTENGTSSSSSSASDANKYRPFALVEAEVLHNLRQLISSTTASELVSTTTTMVAGALTLALSYINRISLSLSPTVAPGTNPTPIDTTTSSSTQSNNTVLNSRILILSTSGDLAAQYIPIMNLIFAAQHSRIPIDILKLAGDTILLQQASYTTSGVFLSPFPPHPAANSSNGAAINNPKALSLLPTLLFAYLPDAAARAHLILPTSPNVDFRAACFCHRRVVDLGFVCSICLSIFCADALPLLDQRCLTCGTILKVDINPGGVGGILEDGMGRKKKKRKKVDSADGAAT